MKREARIDPGLLERAEHAARRAASRPEHARQAQQMATGIRQIRAAGGSTSTLPDGSAGQATGEFLGILQQSSLGGYDVRAAQNLDTDQARRDQLATVYRAHYRSLLGLAALLLDDTASCEDVVQEAFIRVYSARNRVHDPDKTLACLRQTVVNFSRSALRRRILGIGVLPKPLPAMASAEEGAYEILERDQLMEAMRSLQRRQREVLVLRYFADMTETQVAETLGLSVGSVKAYGSRGLAALRAAMERTPPS